jgi:hypothetical protein
MSTTDVPFITPAIVAAARQAAALDQRINGHKATDLTIKTNLYATAWAVDDDSDALLHYADGGILYCSPFRPVDDRMPAVIRASAERRHAAAEKLRILLAELPFNGEPLRIPLRAYAA